MLNMLLLSFPIKMSTVFPQAIRNKLVGMSPIKKMKIPENVEFDVSSKSHLLIKQIALLRKSSEKRREMNQAFVVDGNFILKYMRGNSDEAIQGFSKILVPGENPYWNQPGLFPTGTKVVKVPRDILKYLRYERDFHVRSDDDAELVCGITRGLPEVKDVEEIEKGRYLVLDSVQNPKNVGLLVNYASKYFNGIIPLGSSCDFFDFKSIQASKGAVIMKHGNFHMFHKVKNHMEFYKLLASKNFLPIVADVKGVRIENYADSIKSSKALFVVVGNEGSGASKETMEYSTRVSIPMTDSIQSLNAAVAGSILISEIMNLSNT
jgi:tRNA G18 (ribose-2'-O)-methylase SpoU